MKILIADAFDKSLPKRLEKFGEVFDTMDRVAEADVILVRSKTKADKAFIDNAKSVKLFIRGGVGMDNIDAAYCKEKGIAAMNTPEASSVAVAELAMALMIAIPARLVDGHNGIVAGKFLKSELKRTELYQKTLGLIGVGRIGTEVAKRAQAFGMKVIAFDKFIDKHPIVELVSLDKLLAGADYISLHTPLTDETKGMINKGTIARMKKGAVIINTGRGKCVVEEDVAEALRSGQLGGYGTDVWYKDEIYGSPIVGAPNTVVMPHLGASSKENLLRIGDCVVDILSKWNK
ncbi:MAG: NAD(P)-dependent oxidoreductase [Deltaproteobacteria bacterium]|nr:NAD(P)-dependent oxidoreductase [Deltaproteobacteria bacterium]